MTPRQRRIALVVLAVAAATLLLAPAALAAAGGGSSGFGGGGGGGGGRGGGFALYILFQLLFRIALLGHGLGALALLALFIGYLILSRMVPGVRHFWSTQESQGPAARRRSAQRQRSVELAAAEAADDDPAFGPDRVRADAAELFRGIQEAWDRDDRSTLAMLVAPDLMQEWERRLNDFSRKGWRNRVQPLEPPRIEYVGLNRSGGDGADTVTVRIESRLRDYVEDSQGRHLKHLGNVTETSRIREYWTLERKANRWVLASIEQGAEGSHALKDQIIATPWADDHGLRDQALVERAVADALPDSVKPSEVAKLEFDGDARAAALDLSLADGRFAPDVLEVAARRAVAAWAQAVDGSDAPLKAIADPAAIEQMLYPGDPGHRTRLVIRGPNVKQIRITGLDAAANPPQMAIDVEIEGRRYIEDRDTAALLAGSRARASSFTEHWVLTLSGDEAQPWRIARAANPVSA